MTSSAKPKGRRTLFAIYVVFLLVLLEGALQVAVGRFDSELMQHGGFEDDEDVSAWAISNVAVARVPDGAVGQAVTLRSLLPNSYAWLDVETSLHVGEVYTLSFYVKAVESQADFLVTISGDQWSDIQGYKDGTATTSFVKHQVTFEITAADQPRVLLYAPQTAASQTLVYDEISLRRVPPGQFAVALEGVGLTNPDTHHELTPNRRFVTEPPEGYFFEPTLNEINSYGVRGPEFDVKSAYRILFVGDSFIEADEVSFADTFGERLNQLFRPDIDFVAHGVSSWAPTTEFSWIHYRGMALQPDEVYLFTYGNDFLEWQTYSMSDQAYRGQAVWENGVPVRYVSADERRAMDRARLHSLEQWGRTTLNRFEIPRLLRGAYALGKEIVSPPLAQAHAQSLLAQDPSSWPGGLRSSVDDTIEVIAALGRYLDERDVKLVVSLIPSGLAWKDEVAMARKLNPGLQLEFDRVDQRSEDFVSPQGDGLNTYLAEALRRHGIEWLDLWQALDAAKAESDVLLYHVRDGHWNRNGHQVVFELLRDRFLEHKRENDDAGSAVVSPGAGTER